MVRSAASPNSVPPFFSITSQLGNRLTCARWAAPVNWWNSPSLNPPRGGGTGLPAARSATDPEPPHGPTLRGPQLLWVLVRHHAASRPTPRTRLCTDEQNWASERSERPAPGGRQRRGSGLPASASRQRQTRRPAASACRSKRSPWFRGCSRSFSPTQPWRRSLRPTALRSHATRASPSFFSRVSSCAGQPARYAQDIARGLGASIPPRVDAKRPAPGSDSRLRPRHRVPDRKTGNTPRTSREPWVRSSPCALNRGPARQLTDRLPVPGDSPTLGGEVRTRRGTRCLKPPRSFTGGSVGGQRRT